MTPIYTRNLGDEHEKNRAQWYTKMAAPASDGRDAASLGLLGRVAASVGLALLFLLPLLALARGCRCGARSDCVRMEAFETAEASMFVSDAGSAAEWTDAPRAQPRWRRQIPLEPAPLTDLRILPDDADARLREPAYRLVPMHRMPRVVPYIVLDLVAADIRCSVMGTYDAMCSAPRAKSSGRPFSTLRADATLEAVRRGGEVPKRIKDVVEVEIEHVNAVWVAAIRPPVATVGRFIVPESTLDADRFFRVNVTLRFDGERRVLLEAEVDAVKRLARTLRAVDITPASSGTRSK